MIKPLVPHTRSTSTRSLYSELSRIRMEVIEEGDRIFQVWKPSIRRSVFLPSAMNLAHFIALRRMDLREIQAQLMIMGLSSLGHCESHVLSNIDAIMAMLSHSVKGSRSPARPTAAEFLRGWNRLSREAGRVLGPQRTNRRVRIMATMPAEAAGDAKLVGALIAEGMELARINCAHGDRDEWKAMIRNIRAAERMSGKKCRVFMDLAGPKLRTDEILSHPQHRIRVGDHLVMAAHNDGARFSGVAFTCTCQEVFALLKAGSEVWIDDGVLGCKVEEIHPMGALLRVFHAPKDGKRIKPDKGVNFPGLVLPIRSLTDKDRKDLDFVAGIADVIGFSFVQSAEDVADLQKEIALRMPAGATAPPIVAKIETQNAVRNLPEIMVRGAGRGNFGVMIARGDLAVEIGYLRLAEIQEEILWLAESADVPVIWATQVLEKMTREGVHSRAELTDAVMGERAECVMLNKGEHLVDAVATLSRILENHESNQQKKIQRLRALKSW
ncbi:MAG: pyruvate kinase [Fibrobacteria bacterium]